MSSSSSSQDVIASFHSSKFHIASMKEKFLAQAQSDLTQAFSDSAMASDPGNPTLVGEEISAQVEFFKKIKFKYLEQEAKETFLKLILADDPEQIDREDNDRLEVENRRSKDVLKAAKVKLGGLKEEVERVAEEVAEKHTTLSASIAEASILNKEIQQMELELARLRTTLPISDRITVEEANVILDDQIVELQTLADDLQAKSALVDSTKREVSKLAKEVDRLGPEKAKEELRVKSALAQREGEDGEGKRVDAICRWYTATLSLHRSFSSITSITPNGSSELRIGLSPGHGGEDDVVLVAMFASPESTEAVVAGNGGGLLVDAALEGSALDISEAVEVAVQANDVPGLVGDVLMRLRAS